MKKIFTLTLIALCGLQALAQSAQDALRYSQTYYTGTARSAAMGNAMTAVGGDFGSLSINPAGSAVYPFSEVVFTPALHSSISRSDYLSNNTQENYSRLGLTNFGYIGAYSTNNRSRTGLISFNLGIGYNGMNNFTERFSATGNTNESSWLAALAANTDGTFALDLDWNDHYSPFHNANHRWSSILAWNSSLLDTIPGTHGYGYKGASEIYFNDNSFGIPGTLQQDYTRKVYGNVGEYLINGSVNISHKLFLGMSIGFQNVWYNYEESYSERAMNPNDYAAQTAFESFTHTYNHSTTGTGVNLKFGAIFVPFKFLRLGASIHTPTWMTLYDEWDETIDAYFSSGNPRNIYLESPVGEYKYKVNTPFKWNVGAAVTLGSYGVISADYEQVSYNKIKMNSSEFKNPFAGENQYMRRNYQTTHNFRLGAELNIPVVSLRGGYAYYGNPEKDYGSESHIASAGLGFQSKHFFMDLTYMQRFEKKEYFSLYDDIYDGSDLLISAPIGEQATSNWKLLLSIGFRF